jgi:hypothetical protein
MNEEKDQRLWRIAKKRAAFKHNLSSFIIINTLLWIIWWYTKGRHGQDTSWPWPLWVLIFWGLGIVFNFLDAYFGDKETMAESEYKKLKKRESE